MESHYSLEDYLKSKMIQVPLEMEDGTGIVYLTEADVDALMPSIIDYAKQYNSKGDK